MKDIYDVIIVGAGPAGLAAAVSAYDNGAQDVLLLERNECLGGILNQCIHNGFGLHYFNQELTGPEYAQKFIDKLSKTKVEYMTDTMVISVGKDKTVCAINPKYGYMALKAKAVILAMGCRERPRGAIGILGGRLSGIFTAGSAQNYVNLEGLKVGKRAVILGSGDIGLIMARRLSLEGSKVLGVYELMPYSGGLKRNIVQCLNDYNIPLHLSHTITRIYGERRVEGVEIQKVDETLKPIDGTKEDIACDTVLLSVGLLPENELTRQAGISIDPKTLGPAVFEDMQTDVEGIFSCGNVCHVHDLVDFVTQESIAAGESAARFVKKKESYTGKVLNVKVGDGIGQCVPHKIRVDALDKGVEISFRVNAIYKESEIAVSADGKALAKYKKQSLAPGEMEKVFVPKNLIAGANGELTLSVIGEKIKKDDSAQRACVDNKDGTFDLICIVCPKGCAIHVNVKDNYKTTGNSCPRGAEYAYKELTAPTRVITSTAIIKGASLPRVPVKTDKDIDKSKIFESMAKLNNLAVKANIKIGDVVAADIDGKGANFVATRDMPETDLPKI